jgi:hypothetical protein
MSPSARAIATLNIKHYRNLLKTQNDRVKRTTILKLLAEEEKKLKDFLGAPDPIPDCHWFVHSP